MTPDQLAALRRIAEAAVAAERETGCPAEISAAQCIVESAWLQVAPGNNCFGVKAMDDHCQYCFTKEYLNGEWTSQKLAFAIYPTLAACFAAHAHLLQSGAYAAAWLLYQGDHNLDAYIRGIAEHDATDPGYAAKILQLAHGPHVAAAIVEARQRDRPEEGSWVRHDTSSPNEDSTMTALITCPPPRPISELDAAFADFLRVDVASGDAFEDTIRNYRNEVALWLAWCVEQGFDAATATVTHIKRYRSALIEAKYNPITIRWKLSIVRRFYEAGDLRAVQEFLGHADPRMTSKYAHVVDMAKKNPALFIPVKVG